MQHHFVVYFDDVTKTWNVDAETTDARFDSNVWNTTTDDWEYWNDATSEALNSLIDLIEIDSESSDEQLLEDENKDYVEMAQEGWDDDLIEDTDYLEEDDE